MAEVGQSTRAAVLRQLATNPRHEEFPDPIPAEEEVLVKVNVAPLTNPSKSRARGSHHDGYEQLPKVSGKEP